MFLSVTLCAGAGANPDAAGPDATGPDATGPDPTGPDPTGPEATGHHPTGPDATDLGHLLHKHPDRAQSFPVSSGTAHVFYSEVTPHRCTAVLLLEVDPITLSRRSRGSADPASLAPYVNDRPYAASSLLAVAIAKVFGTAMSGRSQSRPELAARPLNLEFAIPALPCRGGPELAHRMFEPLGWTVRAEQPPVDPAFPGWGRSRYLDVRLSGRTRLADSLGALYVLLPVLDDAKHYWVTTDEVDKLVRAGQGWLARHPERDLILARYLSHRPSLVASAVDRLAAIDDADEQALDTTDEQSVDEAPASTPDDAGSADPNHARAPDDVTPDYVTPDYVTPDGVAATEARQVETPETRPPSLAEQRRQAVLGVLRASGARSVADLGCGDAALLALLLWDRTFTHLTDVDVCVRALQQAVRRLRLDRMPERDRTRLSLFQSSLTYRDRRLVDFDAAVLMEVIEHVDPPRLMALERCVFAEARPRTVVVTTPNVEYNVRFAGMTPGALRHRDHRFEWTREQFRNWADAVSRRYGYEARTEPVGPDDAEVGPPTQMAVFRLRLQPQVPPPHSQPPLPPRSAWP